MKRFLVIFLVGVLLLAGCGRSKPVETVPQTTAGVTAPAVEEALAMCEKGIDAVENEDYEGAEADFQQAVSLDETLADAWLGLADVYIRTGDFAAAIETLTKAQELVSSGAVDGKLEELKSGSVINPSGQLQYRAEFDGNGELLWYHHMTYYPDGRLHWTTSYDAQGNKTGSVEEIYENGILVQGGFFLTDGTILRAEYGYDEEYRIIRHDVYTLDGALKDSALYEYDSQGRITVEISYDYLEQGVSETKYVWEYDEGNLMSREFCYGDGILEGMWEYRFDKNGQTVESLFYLPDGKLDGRTAYEYDEEGNEILRVYFDANGNEVGRLASG